MPKEIVTEIKHIETCPAPECNLSGKNVEQFVEELEQYTRLFKSAFDRREQWEKSQIYVKGLLGNTARKTVERMALEMGESIRALQHFSGQSPWEKDPLLEIHQGEIAKMLSEEDGVALIDETGNVKQGQNSVGVAPQYCGSVGKVANSQVGVALGYASRKGYTLLDSQIFMPDEWFDDEHEELRKNTGVPAELSYKTKPEIALELLTSATKRNKTLPKQLEIKWVAADALYGDSIAFRDGVAALGKWYFTAIKSTILVWIQRPEVYLPEWKGRGPHPKRLRLRYATDKAITVQEVAKKIPSADWTRATIKEGSKGPIVCDFAFLRVTECREALPGQEVWLIIRRDVNDPSELKFYFSNAPTDISLLELVRVCGMRWPIETIFKESKGEIGLDHYETRSWLGWHHHMILVALSHHFLVRLRIKFKDKSPALTFDQVRLLLTSVLPRPAFDASAALRMIVYYQKRNYVAYVSHRKARLALLGLSNLSNVAL